MDDFQFIIESPQSTEGHRKRPRLVTSCDSCRLKKIKCLLPTGSPPGSKCEACKTAKISCRFRDRERYFAERSRAITASAVGADLDRSSSSSSHSSSRRSPSGSPPVDGSSFYARPGLPYARSGSRGDHMHMSPDPYRDSPGPALFLDSSHHSYARRPAQHSRSSSGASHSDHSSSSAGLFDPRYPQRPHPRLLAQFIPVLFQSMGSQIPFMTEDEIMGQLYSETLSPLLACCLAALATRYCDLPEVTSRGAGNVAQVYENQAKNMLVSVMQSPRLEILHALILVAWSEYKNSRVADFRAYIQMAMQMALDLGLSDESSIQFNYSESERNRMRLTWTSVVQLHFFATSLTA